MSVKIRKILFPTDLSENARHAFTYAISIADAFNAMITVVHVLEELSPSTRSLIREMIGEKRWKTLNKENQDQVIALLKKRLQEFCDEISRSTPECPFIVEDILVLTGHPVDRIVDLAEKKKFDLIVMGSRGHGTITESLLGSTSGQVLKRSRKPVMTVRSSDGP